MGEVASFDELGRRISGNTRLTALHRDIPGSTVLFETAIERIKAFSQRLSQDPSILSNSVWTLYSQGSPLLGLWLARTPEGKVVGHAVGMIEQFEGKYVFWVNQVQMDEVAGRALVEHFLTTIDNFVLAFNQHAKVTGITIRDIFMRSRRTTDAWARHAGFEDYAVIRRREVR